MLNLLIKWILFAIVIIFTAWIVPGISVSSFPAALFACIVIALINTFIKPVVQLISLPVNFLTLGLFSFVINALLLMLAGIISPGFEVKGFLSALFGSIILAIFAGLIYNTDNRKEL